MANSSFFLAAAGTSYSAESATEIANSFSAEQEKAIEATGEKFEFQAEVNRLNLTSLH